VRSERGINIIIIIIIIIIRYGYNKEDGRIKNVSIKSISGLENSRLCVEAAGASHTLEHSVAHKDK
jgi:hypothetical protein